MVNIKLKLKLKQGGFKLRNRIREIRFRQGMSQKDLARRADICQSILCSIEKERVKPGVNDIRRISRALKTDVKNVFPEALSEIKKDSAESLAAPAESANQSTNGGDPTHGN